MRHKARIALGAMLVVVLAALIATSAGGAAGEGRSAADDVLPTKADAVPAKPDTVPPSLAEMAANPESAVAEYELQAAQARHVELRSGTGDVWFIPGRTGGACLFQADDADYGGGCANSDEIASGQLVLVELPPPTAETPAPATFIGYAPANVTAIRLVDKDGGVVSEITPPEDTRIYDFSLGASSAVKIVLADASGKEVSTRPIPRATPG